MKFKSILLLICVICCSVCQAQKKTSSDIWKVGMARKNITPTTSMWMAGYAARTSPSEGKLHDLWAKALTLEDSEGHRALLITMDLLGIPKGFSDKLRDKIKEKFGLEKSQIILSSSHTHSGPVLSNALKYIYPMDSTEWGKVDQYTKDLGMILLRLVDESMKNMKPARIYTQNGIVRFQVNRRNNKESALLSTTVLNGPNDYAVPVIKVEDLNKNLIAIVFGYACHPTVLSINKFSGDYVGFAQIELEKRYPGIQAMFFQGAGADQNPLPRHTIPLAVQYGKQLADAVERVLCENMIMQRSKLITKYKEIDIPLDDPLPISQLQIIKERKDYEGRWAQGMINEYNQKGTFQKSYPYPMSYWEIGNQRIFALGGEVVTFYAVKLKEIFGQEIFVVGYANDVMAYIPSALIIDEGGYEGDTAQRVYGLPAKWNKKIESLIVKGATEIADRVN